MKEPGERETTMSFARSRRARDSSELSFFLLSYRDPNGFAVALVIESKALVAARMQAAVFGLDGGFAFVSGHKLDATSAEHIPANMVDRLLDGEDLRRLHRMRGPMQSPPGTQVSRETAHKTYGDKPDAICRRFAQCYTWSDIDALYGLAGTVHNLQRHYNIAPGRLIDVVKSTDGVAELVSMRWGLVPFWWRRTPKSLPATFNARAESIIDEPMFRDAFERRRCIIPVTGYYEWVAKPGGWQPYFVGAADGGVLSLAGLWDRWRNPRTGEPVISCTIIVTAANAPTGTLHSCMPVMLDRADLGLWLAGTAGTELLRPTASDRLRIWPVSRRVNKIGSGDDDPTLIAEVTVRPPRRSRRPRALLARDVRRLGSSENYYNGERVARN